ncbi:MAG: GHKL domain-containing protein [Epsilonproteobacteria bacterium]|nr:GHKL domain-containing protein [Campylobacterota bacterium]
MKTFNLTYKSSKMLEKFILLNNISKHDEVLVQIFTGFIDKDFITSLLSKVLTLIPNAKIIGSTTDGEIIDGEIKSYATVLSFSVFENTTIKTCYIPKHGSDKLLAKNLYQKLDNPDKIKLMITFLDGLHSNGEIFLKTFEKYNDSIIMAGGLAGDNAEFKKTFVFDEHGCYDNGVVSASFYNDDLVVGTTKSFGWKKIGKKLKITKSKHNIVYTINDMLAVDVYKKYLGLEISSELPATGIEFPLILNRNGINIARAVLGIDKDNNALIFAGDIQEGEIVQFGYGDIETIESLAQETTTNVLNKAVESIFIYSCMARKKLMGDSVLNEIVPLSNLAPTSGFFTYGEIFTIGKKYEFLNQTMTILTLSENKESRLENTGFGSKKKESNKTINALTHLVGVTVEELSELNKNLEKKVKIEVDKNILKDKQLIYQSRLAQMGEMISMIAHQWRQPLAAISSAAIGLKLKTTLKKVDEKLILEICEKIIYSSSHLSKTIDDFRDFYKSNKEKKDVTFSEIVKGVLNIVQASMKNKNIEIEVDLNFNDTLRTYPNELKQVLMNLIKNAEDALLESRVENPKIMIKTYKENQKCVLEVSDNAGGIDEKIISKIFDPYFSTKKAKDGTGLGLYMSKTIIQEHCNGKIYGYNNEVGAVFKIELENTLD